MCMKLAMYVSEQRCPFLVTTKIWWTADRVAEIGVGRGNGLVEDGRAGLTASSRNSQNYWTVYARTQLHPSLRNEANGKGKTANGSKRRLHSYPLRFCDQNDLWWPLSQFLDFGDFLPLVVHLPSKLKWHTRRFVRSGPWTFWILSAFTHCGYVRNAIYFKVTNCFLFRVAMKRKSHGCDGNRQLCFLCEDIWVE